MTNEYICDVEAVLARRYDNGGDQRRSSPILGLRLPCWMCFASPSTSIRTHVSTRRWNRFWNTGQCDARWGRVTSASARCFCRWSTRCFVTICSTTSTSCRFTTMRKRTSASWRHSTFSNPNSMQAAGWSSNARIASSPAGYAQRQAREYHLKPLEGISTIPKWTMNSTCE